MTRDGFRRLALSMPEASVRGELTPERPEAFVCAEPTAFVPVKGGWGLKGATNVRLRPAKARSLRVALAAAWRNVAPRLLAEGKARR